jgi:Undecaprenyl-phosphate glucose phosphotransferase
MNQHRKGNFQGTRVAAPLTEAQAGKAGRVALPFDLVEHAVAAADFVLVVGTSVLAGVAYGALFDRYVGDVVGLLGVGALVFINFFTVMAMRGNYKPPALADFGEQAREVTATWLMICLLLLAIAFSLKVSDSYSRGATLSFFASGWFVLISWRALLAHLIGRTLAAGSFAEQRILVLTEQGRTSASRTMQELQRCGYRAVHTLALRLEGGDGPAVSSTTRAMLQELIETCRRDRIDQVFLDVSWQHRWAIDEIVETLGELSSPIHLLPDDNVAHFLGNRTITLGTAWATELKRAPLSPTEQVLKRAMDLALASIGLVLLAPLMGAVALMIRLGSPGPVFFIQKRKGFNGETFGVRKFRTMRVAEDGPVIRQATRNDPRITRLGRWLRRTSIDELPQLFNVITGDMSLVGPRPHAVAHDNEYEKVVDKYAHRHRLKPGITGWAQVNGLRGETKSVEMMARRVESDLWYINNWSLWLDIKILFRTLIVLGFQSTAY